MSLDNAERADALVDLSEAVCAGRVALPQKLREVLEASETAVQPQRRVTTTGDVMFRDEQGRLHRTDGPAEIFANGDQLWYRHGVLHRSDGPAMEFGDGLRAWLVNGVFHRTDGPAVERADGTKVFWVDGHRMDEADFWRDHGSSHSEK